MKKPPHAQADIKTLESTKPDREVSAYFSDHGEAKTPVYIGSQLPAQSKIQGPAIIEEPTTTVVVYPRTSALVTSNGHYLLTPAK